MFKHWFRRCEPAGNNKQGLNACPDECPNKCPDKCADDCIDKYSGYCPLHPEMTLDCLQLNQTAEIHTVPDESILEALGFRPGKRVCLRCRARFGGPVVAEIEGRHTALARSLARRIHLRSRQTPVPEYD